MQNPNPRIACLETTYTPQGDGKTLAGLCANRMYETTYTPQGDGKDCAQTSQRILSGNNLHPARGRQNMCVNQPIDKILKQPTPRKGTANRPTIVSLEKGEETTYTPQGDGKRHSPQHGQYGYRNNLHPARGRQIYIVVLHRIPSGNNLHPARGRNNVQSITMFCNCFMNQLTPRKGTTHAKSILHYPQKERSDTPCTSKHLMPPSADF